MYVCMYVYVYVCMYVCICMYNNVYICICIYVCMYVYMCICMYSGMYVCSALYVCMYVCMYVKKKKQFRLHVILLKMNALLLLSLILVGEAGNPFNSQVIELTSQTWKKEVTESPHAYFVNFCREG
jgi:hypothetical protein